VAEITGGAGRHGFGADPAPPTASHDGTFVIESRPKRRGRGAFSIALTLGEGVLVQVLVRDNNVDQALRALKKKMQREGIFREMKLRRNYEKPSERRAREKAEAVRRYRKLLRKRMDREGY
jgi:small subunit ribosomal protein S21